MSGQSSTNSPHRVLIAPDKFKGTMTAKQAGSAILSGLQRAWPDAEFTLIALADGGEGFTECLIEARHGRLHVAKTLDALGRACTAGWGEIDAGRTAVLDIASASGLAELSPSERNPSLTSTLGTGIVLRELIARGFETIYLGLGGSATNDAGVGIAVALGFRFLDSGGREVPSNGGALSAIARIEAPPSSPFVRFVIATDVDNPLYGPDGAACQFAAQKGADATTIRRLDDGLQHFAATVSKHVGQDLWARSGAGAAGGVGFGMMALLNAERRSGFEVLREQLHLDRLIETHDLIVTGEGAFDVTSLAGKAPARLAQLARKLTKPIWGLFGRCDVANTADYFDRHASLSEGEGAVEVPNTLGLNLERLSRAAFDLARG
jgi:glycerate 2-kinase